MHLTLNGHRQLYKVFDRFNRRRLFTAYVPKEFTYLLLSPLPLKYQCFLDILVTAADKKSKLNVHLLLGMRLFQLD